MRSEEPVHVTEILHRALLAHGYTPEQADGITEGYVWLGDLSGWEVDPGEGSHIVLEHRCGWAEVGTPDGARGGHYVGNLVQHVARELMPRHVCTPHTRSPETAEMVRQWEGSERASGPPRRLPDGRGSIPPMGGMH